MNSWIEDRDVVIIGAGLAGLAAALAFHRKGISSVVLERAESLRATGVGIYIQTNGWRALDQLGLGPKLRVKALPIRATRDIALDKGVTREAVLRKEDSRCLLRTDLVQALFDGLPPDTVRFSCHIVAIKTDPATSKHVLHFRDGSVATAKILIGCDGVNSIIADTLQLKPLHTCPVAAVRGVTNYPNGHGFGTDMVRIKQGGVLIGRIPSTDKLLYWFVAMPQVPTNSEIAGKPELIKQVTLKALERFPEEAIEMVKNCDPGFPIYTDIRYRAPWEVFLNTYRKGTMTIAGDAMHAMGPFLAQGGSAAVEDAIVLARSLSKALDDDGNPEGKQLVTRVEAALDEYIKQRRMRITRLSLLTYLAGLLMETKSWLLSRFLPLVLLAFFGGPFGACQYDCGRL